MDSLKSIEAIAAELEAMGMICDIDQSRYHPLKVVTGSGDSLVGFRYERGGWVYCLAFDAYLEANGVDRAELEEVLSGLRLM